jgi:sporulation protein YlmC with PRC-barrel domain
MLTLRQVSHAKVLGELNSKGARRKVGTVGYVLFHPTEQRVVGFVVERSDLALMIKRSDRYVALDRIEIVDGELCVNGKAAWGSSAAKRLGIDWDKTVAWAGMPVRAESGKTLGTVGDFVFETPSGALNAIRLSEGATRDTAIGVRDIPVRMVRGFDGEAVGVSDEAALVEVDGGAAAAAGKAAAVAKVKTDQVADAATQKFDDVAVATGEAAGKAVAYAKVQAQAAAKTETGKKAIGWLKALKDEVVDAMGDPDDD